MTLRPYQQAACDAVIQHVKSSIEPCLVDAAPAAGKSHMISYLADYLHDVSGGKKVLCLAPSADLVLQNRAKFRLTGKPCSMFSATAGAKDLRHHVVFGSPLTVKNRISAFMRGYCGVIIDEAHGMTPTIISIIEEMRTANSNLRVIGLTGTPFVLGKGYIFRQWPDGTVNDDTRAREPYFTKCVYRVTAKEMLESKYITPMKIGAINSEEYDTSGIRLMPNGKANHHDLEVAFEGHGRKTASIVADVVRQAQSISGGVMLFGATVQHAKEIMASLPPMNSAMVTADECVMMGAQSTRRAVVDAYRAQRFRYLVSVGALTTGFDVEHTAIIALLRFSESASLVTQILGRAWRLAPGKDFSVVLDYAGVIDRHFPDGDIYNPEIRATKGGGDSEGLRCECPDCGYENRFPAKPDTLEYAKDENGYCLDLTGRRVETEWGPMPGHFGRRCWGMVQAGPGKLDRCGYRWTSRECPVCAAANDIAARYCSECKAELVDPGEKLRFEFRAMKKDPTQPQCDDVVEVRFVRGVSQRGAETVRAEWTTPYRKLTTWHMPHAPHARGRRDWERFAAATAEGTVPPRTISYVKEPSGFYRALAFNAEPDHAPV